MPSTPGIISYTETVWNTNTTPKTAVISWNPGDVVVYLAGNESNSTLAVPTGAGITFSQLQSAGSSAAFCNTMLAAAQPTGTGSGVTITGTEPVGPSFWGFGLFVIRGARGVGNSVEQHTTTKTVGLTPSAVNSLIIWGCFDFEAAGAVTPTPTLPAVVTRHSEDIGTNYSIGVFSMINQTSPSSVSYGGVFGGVAGPYSLVAVDIPGLGYVTRINPKDRLKPAPFRPGSPRGRF